MKGHVAHCFRCIYTWRIRRAKRPSVCPRCKSRLYHVPPIRPPVHGVGLVGMSELIDPYRAEIRRLVREHGFRQPRIFGSVARGEARPGSDIDVLVRSWKGDIFDRAMLAKDLGRLLGRPVDVVPDRGLQWYAEPYILAEAVPV